MFWHTFLYQNQFFKRFLQSFEFIKSCDLFWEIQMHIKKTCDDISIIKLK